MDIDASQYAEMSREMLQKGDYLHIYDRGMEYLDKPPFLFWVSAASMKVFGINNFGFKFPSILFALWALYSTYRLGKLLYDETTGRMAALVLATCQGMWLMTNDVRTDTILMSWTITAVWLIQEWLANGKLKYLLGGFAAAAFGMMTKGPIALMAPVFCFATDWALKREWKNFLRPQYLLGILVMAILLIPMSIGLYQQFDMHPEKMVNDHTHVSGLRFFYWSQSFGRITGESPWKNGAGIDFLLLNMLWSFLPWILLFAAALITNIVTVAKQRFRLKPGQEWVTTGGFILTYLALGSSAYQLPHYIFIAFPLAAIFTAKYIRDIAETNKNKSISRVFRVMQPVVSLLLLMASFVFITYFFPARASAVALWSLGFLAWLYLAYVKDLTGRFFWLSAAAMVLVNVFLNLHVYPSLLKYQVGSEAGQYIREHSIQPDDVIAYKIEDPLNCLHFYARGVIGRVDTATNIRDKHYVLTMDKGLSDLTTAGYKYDTVKKDYFYKVSELTPDFLNPKTRAKTCRMYYLVKLRS
jgi:4-amino-4-deoxy-L-arabinose transferase-like glycosyltransferase